MYRLSRKATLFAALFVSLQVFAQPKPAALTGMARITRTNGLATVASNDPRPLDQAIIAVREEYGLLVDYEDPIYTAADLVDDTDPAWKETHPGRPSVTRVRGNSFSSSYSEATVTFPASREEPLRKILSDYNQSGNPGQFKLVKENKSRFAVVPLLATPLDEVESLNAGLYTLADAVSALAAAISNTSHIRVVVGSMPLGPVSQGTYRDDGKPELARNKLASILESAELPLVYGLLYDADSGQYFLNYFVARQAWTSATGERLLVPLHQR
jgi:hypothetical protein